MRMKFASKTLFAPVLAGSLALGSITAPASADPEDTVRAIAGIAALALIVGAINDNDNNNRKNTTVARHNHNTYTTNNRIYGTVTNAPNWTSTSAAKRRVLPERCIRTVRTNNGLRTVYGNRCLQRNFNFANFLPENCKVRIRTGENRIRSAYATRCLRRDGWKVHNGNRYPRFASND